MMIPNLANLEYFRQNFPMHTAQATEYLFASETDFMRIISN